MEDFDLLIRTGVFPYKYIDCVEKLENTRVNYFSVYWRATLYPRAITLTSRTYGSDSLFECSVNIILENRYLIISINIFENFHESCVASYGLDLAHYY